MSKERMAFDPVIAYLNGDATPEEKKEEETE